MGVLFTNNASTTLSAAISSTSATSISVASSSTFPAPGAGEYFYATIDDGTNNEIVKVTAVSGTTWTVVRGSDNTTARTFSSGDTVQLRAAAALLTDIQQNIAAKSANQTVYNATTASSATTYNVGTDPQDEANAMVFLDGVMQHHDTFSFSGSTLTFDAAPSNGLKLEVIIDNLINLQSSNLTVDTFTATNGQTAFTLSDTPAAEDNLIVFIEGVFQNQDSYSISNNTLTMSAGVTTGRKVVVYVINPVNIGTPSDGTVTSAKLSGNITTPGTLTVGSYDVAFDSPTFVVDNSNSRVGLGTASPSVPVDIVGDVKMSSTLELTSHLDMPDNAKIKLGTGDDLEVYHDGSHNYIDAVTGDQDIIFKGTDSSSDITALTLDMSEAGNATFNGSVTANAGVVVDELTIDADTITATDDFIIDAVGDITLDADGGDITFKDGGSSIGRFKNNSGNFVIKSEGSDDDLKFLGNDGGSEITALTLDMSDAGKAQFNSSVGIGAAPSTDLFVYNSSALSHIRTNSDVSQSNGAVFGKLSFQGNDNEEISLRAFYDHATSAYSGLSFHYDGAAGTVEAMRITSAGRVGIGSADPDEILHVEGSSLFDIYNAGTEEGLFFRQNFSNANKYNLSIMTYQHNGSSDDGLTIGSYNGFSVCTGSNSRQERMRIDSDGKMLIGDSASHTTDLLQIETPASGGGHGIQIRRNDSNTDQGIGWIQFGNNTDTDLARISAKTDGANDNGALLFSTQPASGSLAERMRINSSGQLLVGITSAYDTDFTLGGTAHTGVSLIGTQNSGTGSTHYPAIFRSNGNSTIGSILTSNTGTSFNTSSDYRLKDVKGSIQNGLERTLALNPVEFTWKSDGAMSEGFIAHEVQESGWLEGVSGEKDSDKMQEMDYGRITPLLVKAIQEQQKQVEELKQEIEALKYGINKSNR